MVIGICMRRRWSEGNSVFSLFSLCCVCQRPVNSDIVNDAFPSFWRYVRYVASRWMYDGSHRNTKKMFRFGISRSWEEIFTIRRPISNSNRCGRFFGAWGLTELFRWRYINCCWWTKTKDFVHEKTRNLLYYTSSNSTSKAILICLRFIRIVERWLSWSKWTLSFYMNSGGLRINRVFRYCSKYML